MPGEELSERKKKILKAIVESHIEAGEPVGSKYLLESQGLTCSSATIRNEMSELEELGYLEKTHTSSGRVPSELGYRFYVDTLVEHYAMTANEIVQINTLLKAKMSELDQLLLTASKLASSMTNYTSFAIKPKINSVTVSHFEMMFLTDKNFILIALNSNGEVKSKHVSVEKPTTKETIATLTDGLNRLFVGLTAEQMTMPLMLQLEALTDGNDELSGTVMKCIYNILQEGNNGEMKVTGLDHLLSYPEYKDGEQLQHLIGTLEEKEEILDLVSESESDDIRVIIGSETSVKEMNNSALIYKPIVKDGKTVGAIGILGPRRMDYGKVLSTLEGISGNVSNLIAGESEEKKDG